VFEGLKVMLPHKPDVYLNNLYGDYMQIPPPEKRDGIILWELILMKRPYNNFYFIKSI
jgi:hypothetical protein